MVNLLLDNPSDPELAWALQLAQAEAKLPGFREAVWAFDGARERLPETASLADVFRGMGAPAVATMLEAAGSMVKTLDGSTMQPGQVPTGYTSAVGDEQLIRGAGGQPPTVVCPASFDVAKALTDPQERASRLLRARAASPGTYEGAKGGTEFDRVDKLYLESSPPCDWVRSLERAQKVRAAQIAASERAAEARAPAERTTKLRLEGGQLEKVILDSDREIGAIEKQGVRDPRSGRRVGDLLIARRAAEARLKQLEADPDYAAPERLLLAAHREGTRQLNDRAERHRAILGVCERDGLDPKVDLDYFKAGILLDDDAA